MFSQLTIRCTTAHASNYAAAAVPMFSLNQCAFKIDTLRKCMHTGFTNTPSPALANRSEATAADTTPHWTATRALSLWGGGKARTTHPCDAPPPKAATECPLNTCNPPKQGFFAWLFSKKDQAAVEPLPDVRCCRKKYCRQLNARQADPDLSQFGGQAYKTCGPAYVIQRDRLQRKDPCESREDRLLRQIETNPALHARMFAKDPVKEHDNLFGRLVEMADLKLHPLYRKLACTCTSTATAQPHRTLTGPIDHSHLPAQICINRAQLERKNLYWVHKNIAPPMNLVGRIKETKPRLQPYEKDPCAPVRKKVFDMERCDCNAVQRDTVFDTLKQKPAHFTSCPKDGKPDYIDMTFNHPIN